MLFPSAAPAGGPAYKLAFLTGAPHLGNAVDHASILT
jgi:hypothetical protein